MKIDFKTFFAWIWLPVFALIMASCSPTKRIARQLDQTWESPDMSRQFTGLLLVDADTRDTLFARNARKAFTPASNMKYFTLYASLRTLPDQVPALKYTNKGDTLVVVGTGDPAALHPDLKDSTAFSFMKAAPHVAMVTSHMQSLPYGPGWSWDDFDRYYMPIRSAFPVYGNVLRMWADSDSLYVRPDFLRDRILPNGPNGTADSHGSMASSFRRAPEENTFYRIPRAGDTLDIPFVTGPEMEREFWSKALGKPIYASSLPSDGLSVLQGVPSDTLYKKLMKESDNFIAEQLMLLVSSTLGDSLSFERARDHALDSLLPGLPQRPRWVDGSGLSRYNLVSPEALVYLLGQLYEEIPRERLFGLLAIGGEPGTLNGRYKDPEQPFLFGKTGSLSNNHNLSGYLITKSGKTVIFSFMNNHYQQPTSQIASRMERALRWVRDHY